MKRYGRFNEYMSHPAMRPAHASGGVTPAGECD